MKKTWLILIGIVALAALAGMGIWGGWFTHPPQEPEPSENSLAQIQESPEDQNAHQGNLETLAKQLKLPAGALDVIFQAIRNHGVPPIQVHQLLLQKTAEFNDLRRQLEPSDSQGADTLPPYAEKVLAALESGDFSRAEDLLARSLTPEEATGLDSEDKEDLVLKILTLARLGRIRNLQLDYEKAAEYFARAGAAAGDNLLALQADLYGWQGTALFLDGKPDEAEKAFKESLKTAESAFAPLHPARVNALNNLAGLYRSTGKLKQAEPLYLRAIAIRKEALGPRHPSVAGVLSDLASLYLAMGDYGQARALLEEALSIREQELGPEDPSVAASLNNLANIYQLSGDSAKARELLERSLAITKKALGPEHIRVAMTLNNLARFSQQQGDLEQARTQYLEALAISEKVLGPTHPDVAAILINLAELDMETDRLDKAEILWRRALNILEATMGSQNEEVAKIKAQLAEIRMANAKKSME
ncbi:MAG: tetratricopeptide repeat protein [Desulfatibacillum sp.]|nr:tetratricopeptide repeat protein [Desulfatibacillum sp.]